MGCFQPQQRGFIISKNKKILYTYIVKWNVILCLPSNMTVLYINRKMFRLTYIQYPYTYTLYIHTEIQLFVALSATKENSSDKNRRPQ